MFQCDFASGISHFRLLAFWTLSSDWCFGPWVECGSACWVRPRSCYSSL